jgi:hypothetical protein
MDYFGAEPLVYLQDTVSVQLEALFRRRHCPLVPHLAEDPRLWLGVVEALAAGSRRGISRAPLVVHEAREEGSRRLLWGKNAPR